jgi:hypothetical protein
MRFLLLAWAPSSPAEVNIKGAVQPNTTLSWTVLDKNQNKQLAGYKIYWRYTDAPQWQ